MPINAADRLEATRPRDPNIHSQSVQNSFNDDLAPVIPPAAKRRKTSRKLPAEQQVQRAPDDVVSQDKMKEMMLAELVREKWAPAELSPGERMTFIVDTVDRMKLTREGIEKLDNDVTRLNENVAATSENVSGISEKVAALSESVAAVGDNVEANQAVILQYVSCFLQVL